MPFDATVLQILIASPSNVDGDLQAIRESIHAWNNAHAREHGVVLLPVMWETHARSRFGRPQEILNDQFVRDVDVAIAVFRGRLGSQTGVPESGTFEEIDLCLSAKKHVIVYLSSQSTPLDELQPDQIAKLQEYKRKLHNRAIVGSYLSLDDLKQKNSNDLFEVVRRLASVRPSSADMTGDDGDRQSAYLGEVRTAVNMAAVACRGELDSGRPTSRAGLALISRFRSAMSTLSLGTTRTCARSHFVGEGRKRVRDLRLSSRTLLRISISLGVTLSARVSW